jgi:hypothetical protein
LSDSQSLKEVESRAAKAAVQNKNQFYNKDADSQSEATNPFYDS